MSNLATGEAALTGESVPIDKVTDAIPCENGMDPDQVPLGDRKNMSYSGELYHDVLCMNSTIVIVRYLIDPFLVLSSSYPRRTRKWYRSCHCYRRLHSNWNHQSSREQHSIY